MGRMGATARAKVERIGHIQLPVAVDRDFEAITQRLPYVSEAFGVDF